MDVFSANMLRSTPTTCPRILMTTISNSIIILPKIVYNLKKVIA